MESWIPGPLKSQPLWSLRLMATVGGAAHGTLFPETPHCSSWPSQAPPPGGPATPVERPGGSVGELVSVGVGG